MTAPVDPDSPLDLLFEALDAGDPEALDQALRSAREGGFDDPLFLVFEVHVARLFGDLSAAEARLERARLGVEESEPELHVAEAELAVASWELPRAERSFRAALEREERPDLWLRLGLVCDALENETEGTRCLERARHLDPDGLGRMAHGDPDAFAELVARAAERLPDRFRAVLEVVGVVIDPVPHRDLARGRELDTPADLLGLFVGASALERSVEDVPEPPSVIYLFQRNLERFCRTPEEVEEQVAVTLYHELGHALGFDEDGVERMGLA